MNRACRSCGSRETERTPAGRCRPCFLAACRRSKDRRWEKHKADSRAYSKANSARIVETRAARRRDDPVYAAKIASQSRRVAAAWREKNPAAHAAHEAKRRARKANAGGSFTPEEWIDLCDLYGNACLSCGTDGPLAADHVIPISRGGSSYIENIQPLCTSCNCRKGTKIIDYRANHINGGRL